MSMIDLSRKFGITPEETKYEKFARMSQTLADLARDHSITILTATQCPRENTDPIHFENSFKPVKELDFVIIDHMSLIK